jgi:hypothetical protein
MPAPPVTVEEVLARWRDRICFADNIRLNDGRFGTVIRSGAIAPLMLEIVLGLPTERAGKRIVVDRSTLFPAWWPEAQWPKPCPSTYTHSTHGKLACEKDEGHLHREGEVEHQRGETKWMSI